MIAKPQHCAPCQIAGNMRGFILPSGTGRIPLLLCGEGGGKNEADEGKPFIGAAGEMLDKALRSGGLKRDDFTISNLLSCRPPGNFLKGAPYEFAALNHCRPFLNATVAERQPRIIVALGDVPLRELSLTKGPISELRGYVFDSVFDGVKIIGTYHPSHLLPRRDQASTAYLFPVLRHDLRTAHQYALHGVPKPLPTNYNLTPTLDDVRAYLDRLRADSSLPISYDCETSEILGIAGASNWRRKTPVQIQFSSVASEAIVLPWESEFIALAKAIMALPNMKISYNGRLSDDLLLRANGFTIGGDTFDAMLMFAHLQPGFTSGKDANSDEDKGIPSRLMSLQSCVSFYYPYELLYKTAMRRSIGKVLDEPDALWQDVRFGGARDSDLTLRIGLKLKHTLEAQDLWDGFYRYKHRLGIVLAEMSDHGLPIDRSEQAKLRAKIESQEQQMESELQAMIPASLYPTKIYKGFPKDLREAVKTAGLWIKCCKPVQFPELATSLGYEIRNGDSELYLCKISPFNADSPLQVMSYIQWQVDQEAALVPTLSERRWFIPIHVDTKKPTTNKAGMESLIKATDDPALKQIEKCKRLAKLKDYCGEKWQPGDDGRVHAEFRVGATATGQTSATNPPIQTYPKHVNPEDEWLVPLMKEIKTIIKAEPGYRMVEVDMTGFHAKVQGHLAGDKKYSRLADFDLHSYNVAHYLKLSDAHQLIHMDDDALDKRLKEIRAAHSYERNFILKRIAYLRQFSGGPNKAASILKIPIPEVMEIFEMMDTEFEPTFKDYPKSVEKMLKQSPTIRSPFKCQRHIWDGDLQQAVAFLPANCAHSHFADAVLRLHDRGALRKYGAANYVHDALWFHVREDLVDECIQVVKEEFQRPSDILVSETMGAFRCKAGASVGMHMAAMADIP